VSVYVPPESLLESKAFRRLLAWSLAGHVLLFAALTFRPRSDAMVFTANPVMVSVVAAPPAAAPRPPAPKAAPKPAPKPPEPKVEPPPPPKPVVNEIVIPKDPAPLPKPKPKPVAKPDPKPKTAEQLLAELTQKVETEHPDSVPDVPPQAQPGPPAPVVGGPGIFDPAMAAWQGKVKALIHSNWSGAQICKDTPIFDLEIDSAGGLEHLALAKSSGDRYCDESAERAVRKSMPLPPSPRGAITIELVLNPKAAS
jgi:TonB family protein